LQAFPRWSYIREFRTVLSAGSAQTTITFYDDNRAQITAHELAMEMGILLGLDRSAIRGNTVTLPVGLKEALERSKECGLLSKSDYDQIGSVCGQIFLKNYENLAGAPSQIKRPEKVRQH
jgi:hypothetical protein